MPSYKKLFYKHVAQTSPYPMIIEVEKADGMYIYDVEGKAYMDLDSGFSVSNLGHRYPAVVEAIVEQTNKYLHTTVYGEHIQSPQVKFAELLVKVLNTDLSSLYYTNSGTEAVEVAFKAARKYTGRHEIISCSHAYHGSTMAAESLRSDLAYTQSFLPGVPGVQHIGFNNLEDLQKITSKTAAIFLEPVQAEAGVISPQNDYLQAVRKRCDEAGCLMVLDEIQTGFGRTGHLFAFQKYGVIPDMLLMAKAMGGGMPCGGVLSKQEIIKSISYNPVLGHINTFGGHPVSIAAAMANLQVLLQENYINQVIHKATLFISMLENHPAIREIRSDGLLIAVSLQDKSLLSQAVDGMMAAGLMVDYFLFNDDSFRIAPPLIITENQIQWACNEMIKVLDGLIVD
jgi:acetylornithine/succinyldiaminopimelate/putrescine aminotransferase